MEMASQLIKVIFLPFVLPGHMKPMVDMARLFARHGANVTIIATKATASGFQQTIDTDFTSGFSIQIHALEFPASQVGLPEGAENIKSGSSQEIVGKIAFGLSLLEDQIEQVFHDLQPDCLVTDMFYHKTVESAAKLGIPRLCYSTSGYFAGCASYSIRKHKPHEGLVSDTQKFSIPGLVHNIEMTTLQLEDIVRNKNNNPEYDAVYEAILDSERRSYGTLCNSFHELEGEYEQLYKSLIGVKSWSVGPVSAWVNRNNEEEKEELQEEEEAEWLNFLNLKQNESVLYVSFGSISRLPHSQLIEIANGLENSGYDFIWVVRNIEGNNDGQSLPQGFEQRMKESKKGYIIWNWAPQVRILKHPAIGGIVTHCGWNSVLESVSAGLPMITWPMFAEQFYNEKLLVDVLKVGVPVGSKINKFWIDDNVDEDDGAMVVTRDEIVKAVKVLMGSGEESKEIRKKARELGESAKRATYEGGSSYNNLVQLMEEVKSIKISRAMEKLN